jgi:hypothetical protein
MKKGVLQARIRRNGLAKLAGNYYLDEDAGLVSQLNSLQKGALVGIQRADGVYTVLGEERIYYLTPSGVAGEVAIGDFLGILRENALSLGKTAPYEFVPLSGGELIWVMNSGVMCALWNTLLLLHSTPAQERSNPSSY